MSLFDDVAKAAARGESAAAAWSRRELLRRAGAVAAGTVATSALIQSVSAPAFATSTTCTDTGRSCGGTCAKCPTGGICAVNADCGSGLCQGGVCKVAVNGACGANVDCGSGLCQAGVCKVPAGGTCASSTSCATGLTCGYDGVCGTKTANGGACGIQQSSNGDLACASGYCSANGQNGTCSNPPVVAVGGTCHGATQAVADANCTSGSTCKTSKGLPATSGKCG